MNQLCVPQYWHMFTTYDVTSWHIDTIHILPNAPKNTTINITDVAYFYMNCWTSCSCLISTIPQYWCRKNKNATGKGGDHKCFGPCSLKVRGVCWNVFVCSDIGSPQVAHLQDCSHYHVTGNSYRQWSGVRYLWTHTVSACTEDDNTTETTVLVSNVADKQ